jgi:hypothetical protein
LSRVGLGKGGSSQAGLVCLEGKAGLSPPEARFSIKCQPTYNINGHRTRLHRIYDMNCRTVSRMRAAHC